jgi:hypothetical protein
MKEPTKQRYSNIIVENRYFLRQIMDKKLKSERVYSQSVSLLVDNNLLSTTNMLLFDGWLKFVVVV